MMHPAMRSLLLVATLFAAACHGSDPATGGTGSASSETTPKPPPPTPEGSGSAATAGSGSGLAGAVADTKPAPPAPPTPPPAADPAPPPGHDFTPEIKALLAVGACGDLPAPDSFDKKLLASHCEGESKDDPGIKKVQADYSDTWVKPARAFFKEHVPADVPKKVVYPFAGGDLSTALTVYPDADEITTMSLEPAGDPRTLAVLKGGELKSALHTVKKELKFLYRVNFSNTLNMIDAMREGSLPTNLIFSLSALKIHGFELVTARYFDFNDDGSLRYLTDEDVAKAPDPGKGKPQTRNRIFANVELQFRKAGGRVQIYRHVQHNLGNEDMPGMKGLKADPRVVKYLEAKGPIAAMTKAASYLLSWESFSVMRDYLLGHVVWMVSDATGVAPKWGKAAGYEYETYGGFIQPHIPAGNGIAKDWRTEFESEPHRELAFRFGYYDKPRANHDHGDNHLVIMRKAKK